MNRAFHFLSFFIVHYELWILLPGPAIPPFPSPKYAKTLKILEENIRKTRSAYDQCALNLNYNLNPERTACWNVLWNAFLQENGCVWDITAEHESSNVRGEFGSHVVAHYDRKTIHLGESQLDVLHCNTPALFLENANGANFYFYPTFIVMEQLHSIAVLAPSDLQISGGRVEVLENTLPAGAKKCDQVWAHAKKDGLPDMRFKENAAVPVAEYFRLNICTASGVRESYLFSQIAEGTAFSQALYSYCANFKK